MGPDTQARAIPEDTGNLAIAPPKRTVNIDKAINGFIVRIGCSTFVAKTWAEASKGLAEYWDDPIKAERKFCK